MGYPTTVRSFTVTNTMPCVPISASITDEICCSELWPSSMFDSLGSDLRTPRRFNLRGKKWKYRGEGNANIVLALSQERKVVRLRKHENGSILEVSKEEEQERVLREMLFCRGMMVPLLGETYIQPPTAAYLELIDVQCLDEMLKAERPVSRHHKGLQFSHVTVYPDYALLPLHLSGFSSGFPQPPTFCVEVKPKQGWIPGPDRRLMKCTFCLNQYLKLQNGTIQSRSRYCPLDLFSGNRMRMQHALHHLLASPQNNLKIFEDGMLVYGDEVKGDLHDVLQRWLGNPDEISSTHRLVEKFCGLIHETLTRKLSSNTIDRKIPVEDLQVTHTHSHLVHERIPGSLVAAVSQVLPEPPCDWSSEQLPQGCILDRILSIQKLEQCGADWIYQAYCSDGVCPGVSDYSYVTSMLKLGYSITPLHRYLLATTAKDCSIMMSFQKIDVTEYRVESQIPSNHLIQDLDGKRYIFNIGVSDLDPKPVSCIEKHRKRDFEILSACLEMLSPQASKM